jgi:uncharacterized iron-regulated membrane protein
MIATGLYLWWPGKARGVAGVFYPRLLRGGRVFWRDLHAVTGVWVSAFALFILLSGLPWAANWGAYFKEIRRLTGTDAIRQDWPSGVERPSLPDMAANDMADMPGMAPSPSSQEAQAAARNGTPPSYAPIDGVIAAVAPLHLADPVVIAPPAHAGDPWTARSDVQNRPLRTDLVIDPRNGAILSRLDFDQHSKIDRVVGIGVAAHEGQLFGWPNQLLSLLTASGLVLMSLSAVVLWRRRRPAGALGAPIAAQERRPPGGLIAAIALFCILLPELAASVIVVALTERLVLSRIPAIRAWLGLRAPTPRVVYRH